MSTNQSIEEIKEKRKLYYQKNKEAKIISSKEYYLKNKEKVQAYKKKYRAKNKEYLKNKDKNYYEENKELISKKQRIYKKNRLKTDSLFRMRENVSSLIRSSFFVKGFTKKSKSQRILGCSYEEFKTHIEAQFLPWMNWNNYGLYNGTEGYGWDLDHIIPLASATCEADIIKLNHYTNYQPLCSYVNRVIKRSKN